MIPLGRMPDGGLERESIGDGVNVGCPCAVAPVEHDGMERYARDEPGEMGGYDALTR